MEVKIPFPEDVYQASMALVCVLLAAYDNEYKQKDNLLIESIHNWTSSNKWTGSLSHKSFEDILRTCSTDIFTLPQNVFAPRDIIEVVETVNVEYLQTYAEYICERLALLKDPRQRMYGADMAIARIKDYQHELCEDSDYDPKNDCFKNTEDEYYRDYAWEERIRSDYKQSQETIDYYHAHYPNADNCHNEEQTESALSASDVEALIAENNQLKQQLAQCNSQMKELDKEKEELKAKLKELLEPVEDLTTEQKVRMEFALQLLEAAGLNDKVLNKRGNRQKAATLMSLLLDIRNENSRGNAAQTCANYISDRRYFPREQNQALLFKLNTLCVELGICVCLNLTAQKQ